MSGDSGHRYSESELQWAATHLDEVAAYARGERILGWMLLATLVLGLAGHLLGYAIGSGAIGIQVLPADLAADLLAAFGVALWTSVAIAIFIEILPRRRQRWIERYARGAIAALRERGEAVPAEVEQALAQPTTDAKLDRILARLEAIERSMTR